MALAGVAVPLKVRVCPAVMLVTFTPVMPVTAIKVGGVKFTVTV